MCAKPYIGEMSRIGTYVHQSCCMNMCINTGDFETKKSALAQRKHQEKVAARDCISTVFFSILLQYAATIEDPSCVQARVRSRSCVDTHIHTTQGLES